MTREQKWHRTDRLRIGLIAAPIILAAAAAATAVQPSQWVHTTEADFNPGETDNVVITNLGDLKLAAGTEQIGNVPDKASIIYDLYRLDDAVYLAAGPEAMLLRREGDKINEVLSLRGEQIFKLAEYDGHLLAAISGEPSRLAILKGDTLETVIELADVRYIWDVIVDGKIVYLATGTEGRLLKVDLRKPAPQPVHGDTDKPQASREDESNKPDAGPGPRITVLLDAEQDNLLCLGRDGQGRLYVGSDTDGLVYRLTEGNGSFESFVMYDASEPEIAALLVQSDGTLYVGTADATQARPGRLQAARKSESGRAEPTKTEMPTEPDEAEPQKTGPDEAEPQKTQPQATEPSEPAQTEPATSTNGKTLPTGSEIAQPSQEQFDRLRLIIKQRLEQTRDEGELSPAQVSSPPADPKPPTSTGKPKPRKRITAAPAKKGNAIYRISPDYFVKEVFRESVMILRIVEDADTLLVATGNDGQIYRVDPRSEETAILVDIEPQQTPAMLVGTDHILLGTANPAMLVRLDRGFAKSGTYTSDVLDAGHISQWGKLHLFARIAEGTGISVELRSGNVADPLQAAWWNWSKAGTLNHGDTVKPLAPIELTTDPPPARFFQYRLKFTGNGDASPVVDKLTLAYVVPNLSPQIAQIIARYAGEPSRGGSGSATARPAGGKTAEPKHDPNLTITWKASDANKDQLSYKLEYRLAGTTKWLTLVDDLAKASHIWPTQRAPDGRYVLRVTASDAPGNPPDMAKAASRRSAPIVIDNTPPTLADLLGPKVTGNSVTLTVAARDDISTIHAVHWAIDGDDDWQATVPADLIFDSTSERVDIIISDLEPGPHVITLRVTDARNNALYKAAFVETK